MQYLIYDTNEYLKLGGKKHRSFEEIISCVDHMHDCEKNKSLIPIFNSTVAYELISHLMSNKVVTQNWYIRACYALYYHCLLENIVITKNPTAAYIKDVLGLETPEAERTLKFLEELYNNPSYKTVERNRGLIVEVKQYIQNLQTSWLHDLKSLRYMSGDKKMDTKKMRDFIETQDYPVWRAKVFLEGVCRFCPRIPKNIIMNDNAINAFVNHHRTYIEVWRKFDRCYLEGKYILDTQKTANTFWDAEICYHVGTHINNTIVGFLTEENQLHEASAIANQGNLLYRRTQMK